MTRFEKLLAGLLIATSVFIIGNVAYAAWDSTKPAQSQTVSAGMASIQGNFAAIEAGTATIGGISATGIVFEGTTADDFETTLSVTDPTADRTITVPNATGAIMLSTLTTNAPDAANSVTGASNQLVLEGATANDFETLITPTDATADRTLTLRDASGTVIISGDTLTGDVGATFDTDGSTAATIQDNSVDGTDIALGSDAQGDVMYYDGTNWVRLAAGTSGQGLQTKGASQNPIWNWLGSWAYVESIAASGTDVASATLPTDSEAFMIVFDDVGASSNDPWGLRFNSDTTTYNDNGTAGQTEITLWSGAATEGVFGQVIFQRADAGGSLIHVYGITVVTGAVTTVGGTFDATATTVNIIRESGAGALDAGEFHLFKLTQS